MSIKVKQISDTFEVFVGHHCTHENAEVMEPCCDGYECGCMGRWLVYCPDCKGKDMTDEEFDWFIYEAQHGIA